MPDKDKIQQALIDFDVTIKAKPNLSDKELLSKFPEFGNDINKLQAAKDYSATLNSGKYKDPSEFNSKFPEFFAEEVKKKDTPSQYLATPSQLPKISEQVSPLQQGANIVGGGVIGEISKTVPKSSIKEAALADKKKNESYLGALWNNAVGSVARLAGGAARATYQFSGNPVIQMERELLDKAGKVMGKNLLAAKEKEYADVVKGVVEKGRTSASSKEYERQIAEGFDVTNGLGASDFKGVVAMLPQFISDMGLAAATGGGSFAIQGYDDALSMVDDMPEGSNISEGTRVAFGVGGALVVGALEKLGLDNLIKNPAAKKYVTAKVIKEATDELVKKGVKVTAEQFENVVKEKASKLTRKELTKIVATRGLKSAAVEGGTEAVQEGGMDLLKLAANKIEGKEIFDEEEMKNTAAKRYLNSLAAGGVLGGIGGSVVSRFQNTEASIKDRLKDAKTVEDIDGIVAEINDNVVDGTMTQEEADNVLPIVQNFVEVSQKVPADLNGKNKVEAVDLINEREKLAEQLKQIEEQKAALDPAFHSQLDGDIKELEERGKEINNQLAELAKPENNVEEVVAEEEIQQPIEDKKADIEKRREQELKERVVYDVFPTVEDGEFKIVGDPNNRIYRINENTGRPQELDPSNGLWSNTALAPNLFMESTKRSGFEKLKENINAKYDAELNALGEQQIPDENIQPPIEEQGEVVEAVRIEQEPEAKPQKVFAEKDLDRAKAKKVHQRVREMEAPSDAAQIALRYIADGGKVSEAAINEVAGTVKRARLNTGAKELKSNEAKSRDYYQKDGETLDELAHRLWENSSQEVSEIDIKDALMSVIGDYNTRLEAGTAYLEQYNAEYQEEQYYARLAEQYKEEFEEEQRKIEELFKEPLEEELLGLASEEHINNLIKQYENELNRENQELRPEGKNDANEKIGSRASGKEDGSEKGKVGEQPIGEAEAKNVVVKLSDLPSRAFAVAITVDRFDELKKKILDEGFTQPIIIDEETGNVLDGQRRLFVADSIGLKEVPAIYMNNPTREELNEKIKELESKNKKVEAKPKQEDVKKEENQKTPPPTPPKEEGKGEDKPDRFEVKSILNRIANSTNISEEVRAKFKSNLKYKVSSQAQAREVAKELIAEFGYKDALAMAEMGRFEGDVNSFIFAESLDNAFDNESKAKTPEEKAKFAEEWKDIAIRYDEAARDKGRFISAIQDFYKKSPLGIVMVEESKRGEQFRNWFSGKEKPFKEVFEELVKEPEFEQLLNEKVKETLKKERGENRAKRRTKIENFFDGAKFKGDALYAVPIPPKVINAALDLMKNSFLAGESVVNAVEVAIEYISKEVGQWDKEKFRKEYQEKLQSLDGGKTTKTQEELTEEKKEKILDKFRKKLKGLSESQKEEVIRKSFKRLVENGALEYDDFKDIIADVLGYGKMTDAEIAKITELVNDINEVDKLAQEIRKEENRSIENLKKYKEAKKKAEKSATQLATLVYNKPDILKRLLSIMQLNTLGIPSLINNPLFNIFNQATVRFPVGLQVSALDQIIYGASKVGNKLFGTDVILPENNVVTSQREFIRKLFQGASESGSQLVNGLTNRDYFQKEVYASQIQPFTSAQDLWDWKFKGKKLTSSQLADKSIQATIGLPAEVVARLLNIGDKPQRFAAEGAKAAVLAKQLGLSNVDYEYFLEFPKEEAYRSYKEQGMTDEAAMEKAEKTKEAIVKAGEESVFQQDNFLNDAINSVFEQSKKYGNVPHGLAQAVKMLNFPYLKIPLNAFWSVYNLVNPEVAFTQSAYYSIKAIKTKDKSDIQKAKMWAAHGTTGMALLAIAGGLVAKGIVNADNDDETTKKERMGEKQYEQQKTINVSKLSALLQGQDPDKVKNGLNVDLKYFGNMGNIMNTVAIRQENMTAEQKAQGANYMNELFSNLSQSSLELIDNGVFSNVSSLVTAFDRGGNYMDNYLLNLINMTTNIFQPAMFAQMSRAQLPYYSKVKADSFYEELKNNVLARSSVVRELTGKYPPAQVGIWGDKLDRKDDFLLKWFGMSKVNKDNFAQPIYEDYKRTNNTEFLPPSIKPLINKNKLTVKQAEELEILVGQSRKALIAPYVNNLATLDGFDKKYSKLKDGEKIKALDILYQQGFEKAKNDFIKKYPQFESKLEKSKDKEDFDEKTKEFRESIKED